MKIYTSKTINDFSYKKKSLVSKPNAIETRQICDDKILLNRFNDQNVIFKAKPTVTMKIQMGKSKLINQFNEILATDVPKLSFEEQLERFAQKAYVVIKQRYKQIEELKFQAEAIFDNKSLSLKQKYDAFNEIDKKIKTIEKNIDKPPKEEKKVQKNYDDIDFGLINMFKTSLMNDEFDLNQVFLDYYSGLESIQSVQELTEKYPKIKVPKDPIDVVVKKSIDLLDRDFYEELSEKFDSEDENANDDITNFVLKKVEPYLNSIVRHSYQDSEFFIKEFLYTFIENVYENLMRIRTEVGFNYIPEKRKQTEPNLSMSDIVMLHVPYEEYVLNVIKQQYLDGKKLNEIEYKDEHVKFLASELKEPEYKFDKVSERIKKIISDSEKLKQAQRDYKNFTLEELKLRLNYYANSELGNIDKIFDIIVDFDGCQFTEEDIKYLIKFLQELDYIKDSKMEYEQAVNYIKDKDLRPHGTEKLNAIEREKIQEKLRLEQQKSMELKSHRKEFDEAILELYKNEMSSVVEVCSKYYPQNLEEKSILDSKKIIQIIKKNISQGKSLRQLEAEIMQWETYNEEAQKSVKTEGFKLAEIYSKSFEESEKEARIGQYLWNKEIVEGYPKNREYFANPELLDKIMSNFSSDKDVCVKLLCKYEDYKLMKPEERSFINNILKIFNAKSSKDKIVLKNIIENDYITCDTNVLPAQIENQVKTTARVFASSAKQQILEKYKFPLCIDFFRAFEEALPLDAKNKKSSGVKKTDTNNEAITYKIEVKIFGHDDRLFSSKNNYYFDIYSDVGLH